MNIQQIRYIDGEIRKYCKPVIEGRHKIKWVTDTFVECLNKTTDPSATDWVPRIHEFLMKGGDTE